ncbi:MAG: hypothetical protein ABL891_00470 [Burkholderiales bacterium]
MKNRNVLAMLVTAMLLLAACANPVPPEKSAYVGQWNAPGMSLLITQDGSVDYRRLKGGVKTSITAPLKKFEGDNFVVGVGLWTTTFVVSRPPREDAGRWKMTVDGVELIRTSASTSVQPVLAIKIQ